MSDDNYCPACSAGIPATTHRGQVPRYSAAGVAAKKDIKWWIPAEAYDAQDIKMQEMMLGAIVQGDRIQELEIELAMLLNTTKKEPDPGPPFEEVLARAQAAIDKVGSQRVPKERMVREGPRTYWIRECLECGMYGSHKMDCSERGK